MTETLREHQEYRQIPYPFTVLKHMSEKIVKAFKRVINMVFLEEEIQRKQYSN